MWLVCHRLGLIGKADLVEIHDQTPYPSTTSAANAAVGITMKSTLRPGPCLEEMLQVSVPRGAIFHVKSQHRREVEFDIALRGRLNRPPSGFAN